MIFKSDYVKFTSFVITFAMFAIFISSAAYQRINTIVPKKEIQTVITVPMAIESKIYPCVHLSGKCATLLRNPLLYRNVTRCESCDIIYVHIPKSGGTSVEDFIMKNVKFNEKIFFDRLKVYNKVKKDVINPSPVLFYSKRVYGFHNHLPSERNVFQMIVMRNPLDRIFSAFYYTLQVSKTINFGDMSLEEALDVYGSAWAEFNNFDVRLLAGEAYPDVWRHCEVTTLDANLTPRLKDYRLPTLTEEHYLHAERVLRDEMAFIGITEFMDESMDMLAHTLGIEEPRRAKMFCGERLCPIKRKTTDKYAEHRDNIDLITQIKYLNQYSFRLYDFALELFNEQYENYISNVTFEHK